MQIINKRQMYDLQLHHRLGNCLQVWTSIPEVRRSSYEGPIAIRALRPRLRIQTHIDQANLERATAEYCESRRCSPEDVVYSEMAAPSMGIQRLLNAHITRFPNGLYLLWNDENIHMPEAEKRFMVAERTVAKAVLDYFVDHNDVDDLHELLEQFPDAVIEFSVLQRDIGWARRRMVVWEVRNY